MRKTSGSAAAGGLPGLSAFTTVAVVVAVVAVVACSPNDEGATNNGVDDVRKACEIRATWSRRSAVECTDCIAISTTPYCECLKKDYSGKCHAQRRAFLDEPSCDGVDTCVARCSNDCDCIERCYAGRDVCRQRASATDGCAALECEIHCR